MQCPCGITLGSTSDFVEEDYCSYYCRRFYSEGLQKVPLSDYKKHKNQWKYPLISHNCDWCGNPKDLRYSDSSGANGNGSGRFCSRECFYTMHREGRRKTKVRYTLLRILSQRGRLHRDSITYLFSRHEPRHGRTVNQVVSLLSIMVRRGMVVRHSNNDYELIDDRPIGQLAAL